MSTNDALETGVSPPTKQTLPKNLNQAQEPSAPSVTETSSLTQRSPWSKEETEKLVHLRDESGLFWEETQSHFPGRSLNSLKQRYHRSSPKNQDGHWKKAQKQVQLNDETNDETTILSAPQRWTEDDDRKLIDLAKGTNRLADFEKLSKEFPERSNRSLQRRHALLKPYVPETPEIDIDSIDDDTLLEFLAEETIVHLRKPLRTRTCCASHSRSLHISMNAHRSY